MNYRKILRKITQDWKSFLIVSGFLAILATLALSAPFIFREMIILLIGSIFLGVLLLLVNILLLNTFIIKRYTQRTIEHINASTKVAAKEKKYLAEQSKILKKMIKGRTDRLHREIGDGLDDLYAQIESKQAIESKLNPRVPIVGLSGWALMPDLALYIAELIETRKPEIFVDLGSGLSTVVAAYAIEKNGTGKVISIEHEEKYLEKTQSILKEHGLEKWVDLYHAPLKKQKVGKETFEWYDISKIDIDKVDILLIDGPPHSTQKLARYSALPKFYTMLASDAVLILDDYSRDDEKEAVERWMDEYKKEFSLDVLHTKKQAAELRRTD